MHKKKEVFILQIYTIADIIYLPFLLIFYFKYCFYKRIEHIVAMLLNPHYLHDHS